MAYNRLYKALGGNTHFGRTDTIHWLLQSMFSLCISPVCPSFSKHLMNIHYVLGITLGGLCSGWWWWWWWWWRWRWWWWCVTCRAMHKHSIIPALWSLQSNGEEATNKLIAIIINAEKETYRSLNVREMVWKSEIMPPRKHRPPPISTNHPSISCPS